MQKILNIKPYLRNIVRYPIPLSKNELDAYRKGSKIFINSLPKSGTFLLRRTMQLFPSFASRWSIHGLDASRPHLYQKIRNIRRGQYASGHVYWSLELTELMTAADIRTVFIIRDLRDVAVSLAYYLPQRKNQHRLQHYFERLDCDDARLMNVIQGASQKLFSDCSSPNTLGEFAMAFQPWLCEPNCLTVRFEDLIGSAGGGSDWRQIETIRAIADYLKLDISDKKTTQIAKQLFFRNSPTFRKGQIGDWQNHFSNEHKQVFKEVAGKALIEFGYEDSYDW